MMVVVASNDNKPFSGYMQKIALYSNFVRLTKRWKYGQCKREGAAIHQCSNRGF